MSNVHLLVKYNPEDRDEYLMYSMYSMNPPVEPGRCRQYRSICLYSPEVSQPGRSRPDTWDTWVHSCRSHSLSGLGIWTRSNKLTRHLSPLMMVSFSVRSWHLNKKWQTYWTLYNTWDCLSRSHSLFGLGIWTKSDKLTGTLETLEPTQVGLILCPVLASGQGFSNLLEPI